MLNMSLQEVIKFGKDMLPEIYSMYLFIHKRNRFAGFIGMYESSI